MRIIKESKLTFYSKQSKYKLAEAPLKAWIYEVRYTLWNNANELKAKYGNVG
jgi:mRNA interferase HigB